MTNIESTAFFRGKIDIASAATREHPRVLLCRTLPQQVHPRITRTFFRRLVLVLSGNRLCRYGDGERFVDRRIVPGDVLLVEPRASLWNEEEGESFPRKTGKTSTSTQETYSQNRPVSLTLSIATGMIS